MSLFSLPVQSHITPLTDHSQNFVPHLFEFSQEAHNEQ